MWAPLFSSARNDASSPVSRSALDIGRIVLAQPSTWCITLLVIGDLGESLTFRDAFDEHHRKVYAAAFGVLNDAALAQDVVQDVFLRLWRRPHAFDPARGDLGAYLRLMGRSRALDLWREAQVRGRAAERLKLVTGEERTDEHPGVIAERDHDGEEVRTAL